MTRDYKPAAPRQKPAGKGGTFFSGLLAGLILGIGVSVGVAIFVTAGESPIVEKSGPAREIPAQGPQPSPESAEGRPAATATPQEKPRFDFYTILPGTESQATEQEIQQSRDKRPAGSESYFLQVGAFQNEDDADNMKAKLALLNMEAVVQTANIPDKGVLHRVRVGPFTDVEQISKARTELTANGFNADLIKINSNVPDQ